MTTKLTSSTLLLALDFAGTLVFAIEGGLAASRGHLDLLGAMVLAFVTALGGGTIRDVLIGAIPPNSIRDWRYGAIAFVGAGMVFLFEDLARHIPAMLLLTLDAAGLSLFAVAGAEKALEFGINPFLAVLMGGITGVGGGTMRDVLLAQIPTVLRADVYATAALAGAVVVVAGRRLKLPRATVTAAGAAICFALRMVSIWRHWNLPMLGHADPKADRSVIRRFRRQLAGGSGHSTLIERRKVPSSKETPPMKKIAPQVLILAGALAMSCSLAKAQQQPMGSTPPSSPANPAANNPETNPIDQMQQQQAASQASMQDKAFARDALEGGMAEVQLGQLATQKGASDDVKQFGQKMVDDHTKLGDQLKPIAQQIGVNPPDRLSKKDQALVAKLNALSGAQFDNAYIAAMVKDHRKDLSDFRQEADNTQNQALKQAAQQGAQVIDQHLQMIEQIAKSHGVKG